MDRFGSLPGRRNTAPRLAAPGLGLMLLVSCGVAPFAHGCGPRSGGTNGQQSGTKEAAQQARTEIDVFVFGRQLGAIAPCGCTTEPLGGLQYAFGYIEANSAPTHRLVLEPGSFLFPDPAGPEAPTDEAAWAQARRRASVLHSRFTALGEGLISGLGPTDVSSSDGTEAVAKWPMPRVLANLDADARAGLPDVASHRIVELGDGVRAGVTAVLDPDLPRPAQFPPVSEPVAAAAAEAKAMRDAGAGLSVVMVHGPRALAEQIAREVEHVDLVIMGGPLVQTERSRLGSAAQKIGGGYLLEPGDQAQTLTHLTLSFDKGTLKDQPRPASEWTLVASRAQREADLRRSEERLAKFEADPSADPTFVSRLRKERDDLAQSLARDELPDDPAVAVFEQIKVTCHLEADATAQQSLATYDGWVAAENRKRFAGVKAPSPGKGEPGYVGIEECEMCHDEAAEQWQGTVHAHAYETLVDLNKQFDLSCVGCHVTGFRQPGGSEVVENEGLRSVQCEQCHGPGGRHIDDPEGVRLPAQTPSKVCAECHTPEHSDTFDYEAYLRDILGEGHGAQARTRLGAGPTGKQLREAGLAKAGGACKKM